MKHKDVIRFGDSIFPAFTGLEDLTIRGGQEGLLGYADMKDCVSTLTQCYGQAQRWRD